jgi:hypothetical protein
MTIGPATTVAGATITTATTRVTNVTRWIAEIIAMVIDMSACKTSISRIAGTV